MAEQSPSATPKSLVAKITEYEQQRERISSAIDTLRSERAAQATAIIDLEDVFRLFRTFQKGFESLPVQKQRDFLKDVVYGILIREDGAHVRYYAAPQEDLLGNLAGDLEIIPLDNKQKSPAEHPSERDVSRTGVRLAFKLVDQALGRTNRAILSDSIHFHVAPKRLDNDVLKKKYLQTNLSAAQLGEEFGLSKQAVLGRLREAGVHGGKGRGRTDDNFRFPNPIFGKKVNQGRLEANLAEMKIVRLIVELRDRQGWSFEKIAEELNRRGHRNRKGSRWHRVMTRHVHKNWTGKV